MSEARDITKMTVKELEGEKFRTISQITVVLKHLKETGVITDEELAQLLVKPSQIKDKDGVDEKYKKKVEDLNNRKKEINKLLKEKNKGKGGKDKKSSGKKLKVVDKKKKDDDEKDKKSIIEKNYKLIISGLCVLILVLCVRSCNKNKDDDSYNYDNDDDSYRTEQTETETPTPTPTPTGYYHDENIYVTPSETSDDEEYETIYTENGIKRVKKSDMDKLRNPENTVAPTSSVPSSSDSNSVTPSSSQASDSTSPSNTDIQALSDYYYNQIYEINLALLRGENIGNYEKADVTIDVKNGDGTGRFIRLGERLEKTRADGIAGKYDASFNENTIKYAKELLQNSSLNLSDEERVKIATVGICAIGYARLFSDMDYAEEFTIFEDAAKAVLGTLPTPSMNMGSK